MIQITTNGETLTLAFADGSVLTTLAEFFARSRHTAAAEAGLIEIVNKRTNRAVLEGVPLGQVTLNGQSFASVDAAVGALNAVIGAGFKSGGGTSQTTPPDYADLEGKPSINSVTLAGNKTPAELGLAQAGITSVGSANDTANDTTLIRYWKIAMLTFPESWHPAALVSCDAAFAYKRSNDQRAGLCRINMDIGGEGFVGVTFSKISGEDFDSHANLGVSVKRVGNSTIAEIWMVKDIAGGDSNVCMLSVGNFVILNRTPNTQHSFVMYPDTTIQQAEQPAGFVRALYQAGGDFVDNAALTDAVNTHNAAGDSHTDIRNAITALRFPVGYVYLSTNAANPASLLGYGTWERIAQGRMLVGVNESETEFNAAAKTGGAKTHTLTANEMPAHNHEIRRDNATSPGYLPTGGQPGSIIAGSSTQPSQNGSFQDRASGDYNNTSGLVSSKGGGAAHNNLPPFYAVYMFRRTA